MGAFSVKIKISGEGSDIVDRNESFKLPRISKSFGSTDFININETSLIINDKVDTEAPSTTPLPLPSWMTSTHKKNANIVLINMSKRNSIKVLFNTTTGAVDGNVVVRPGEAVVFGYAAGAVGDVILLQCINGSAEYTAMYHSAWI